MLCGWQTSCIMTEDHVSSLLISLLNHYKLNSNSQSRKINPFGRPCVVHSVGSPSDRNLMSIPLLWGSAASSANECRRTFVVPSLINISTWQDSLNYLQAHLQHSNHSSWLTSLNFRPDQFFCFISLIKYMNLAGSLLEYFKLAVISSIF